jgi:uncharacterized membrane protein
MTQTSLPHRVEIARTALQWGLGLAAFLAGLDKFANLLADWPAYVAPVMGAVLPISAQTLMWVVGPIEIAVGLAILTRWPREGGFVASAWLLLIAANLVLGGFLDVAVRDVVMAVAAFALAELSSVREAAIAHRFEAAA